MARKKTGRKNNKLQVKVKRVELPAGTTTAEYLKGLLRGMKTGELPEGWDVRLAWRNPDTKKGRSKNWQEGDFNQVIRESRSGFATVVRRILRAAAGDAPEPRPKKKAKVKRPKLPAAELHARRSAASKKGWETRRKKKV